MHFAFRNELGKTSSSERIVAESTPANVRACTPPIFFFVALGMLFIAAVPTLRAQSEVAKPRVAVLEFQNMKADDSERAAATEQLRNELVNLKVYTVLDRAQTESVLGELAFQQGGFTDPSQVIEVGKLLNVEYIVTGRLTRLPNAYQVSAQIIRIATAEIIRSEVVIHLGDFLGLLAEQIPVVAARLAQVAVPTQKVVEVSPSTTKEAGTQPRPPQRRTMMHGPWNWMSAGGKPTWALLGGGMMLAGAAILASRDQASDNSNGSPEVAPVMMAVAGVGMIVFYLISNGEPPTAGPLDNGMSLVGQSLIVELRGNRVRAGLRWNW